MEERDNPVVGVVDVAKGAKVVVAKNIYGSVNIYANRSALDQRNRQAVIKRVRADWIDGLLASSLKNVAKLELRLQPQDDKVDWGMKMLLQVPNGEPASIQSAAEIEKVFQDNGQALLILGEPGTGKTTLLLELAKSLLDQAEGDESLPIPVDSISRVGLQGALISKLG